MNWKNFSMHTRTVSSKNSNVIESEQKSECESFWLLFYGKKQKFFENICLSKRKTKAGGKQ